MARILVAGFCMAPGPTRVGVQLMHVVKALLPEHTVDLLVIRGDDQAYVERQGTLRILRVPMPEGDLRARVLAYARAMRRQLEGAEYDVLHCVDGWAAHAALDVRETFGCKVVFDLGRNAWAEATSLPEADEHALASVEARAIAQADLVLVPGARGLGYRAQRTDRPIAVVPLGVDVDTFDWDDVPAPARPRVMVVGGLVAGRGLKVLLRAFVDVRAAVNAELVLVGDSTPAFRAELEAQIDELGLSEDVTVSPAVEHGAVPRLLASAAVCVCPSAESFGRTAHAVVPSKLLEYLACRRPCVVPRTNTVTELLTHETHALLFSPGEATDLAAQITRLLIEPTLAGQLASAGYAQVRATFTASAVRRAVRSAYRELFLEASGHAASTGETSAPGLFVASEDDYEPTVFEDAPSAPGAAPVTGSGPGPGPGDDRGRQHTSSLELALGALEQRGRGDTSGQIKVRRTLAGMGVVEPSHLHHTHEGPRAPEAPEVDDTSERAPVTGRAATAEMTSPNVALDVPGWEGPGGRALVSGEISPGRKPRATSPRPAALSPDDPDTGSRSL